MLSTLEVRCARATGPCRLLTRLLLAAILVFAAASAGATPLYFDGPFNFGTSQARLDAAQAADPSLQLVNFTDPPAYGAADVSVMDADCSSVAEPWPSSCIALRLEIPPLTFPASQLPPNPSEITPIVGTSTWTVTNSTGLDLAQAFLVFSSNEGALSDRPEWVGLEPATADDYVVISLNGGSYYFPAIELGPMAAGASVSAKVHYRVQDPLGLDPIPNSDDFLLPKLLTEAIVIVPEPGTFLLVAAGLVGFVAMRRR